MRFSSPAAECPAQPGKQTATLVAVFVLLLRGCIWLLASLGESTSAGGASAGGAPAGIISAAGSPDAGGGIAGSAADLAATGALLESALVSCISTSGGPFGSGTLEGLHGNDEVRWDKVQMTWTKQSRIEPQNQFTYPASSAAVFARLPFGCPSWKPRPFLRFGASRGGLSDFLKFGSFAWRICLTSSQLSCGVFEASSCCKAPCRVSHVSLEPRLLLRRVQGPLPWSLQRARAAE